MVTTPASEGHVELGLVLPHSCPTASPAFIRDFAETAEGCGIEKLWAVDHLVLPQHCESPYVLGREPTLVADGWLSDHLAPNYELLTTLSWVAGQTTTVGLGTSVAVLPIRHPVANARQLATLDALSNGRLTYGVGIGWLREEADAMDMPWDRRAARSEEHVAVLRALWSDTDRFVEFHGEFYDFAPLDPRPVPVQRPIPVLIGGHSDAALERAVRIGDGWISAPMSVDRLSERMHTLHRIAESHGRSATELHTVASMSYLSSASFAAEFDRYRSIGVDHLQVLLATDDPAAALDRIGRLQEIRAAG